MSQDKKFDFDEYSELAMRTAGEGDFLEITEFIKNLNTKNFNTDVDHIVVIINKMRQLVAADEHKVGLMYDALGLAGEAGEVADYIKKVMGHGKPFDQEHVEKELGDVLWYVNRMTRRLGKWLSQVAIKNLDKLRTRYPKGFSHAASENRQEKKEEMTLDHVIFSSLRSRGASYSVKDGIVTVVDTDGTIWDFTIPQRKNG